MKGSFPGNDNGTADTNKNGYYRFVGLTSEIHSGKSKSFIISDQRGRSIEIAIFNREGQHYAISNTCIHKGAPLSKGVLEGDIVTWVLLLTLKYRYLRFHSVFLNYTIPK